MKLITENEFNKYSAALPIPNDGRYINAIFRSRYDLPMHYGEMTAFLGTLAVALGTIGLMCSIMLIVGK